jgi:hypothetical protein
VQPKRIHPDTEDREHGEDLLCNQRAFIQIQKIENKARTTSVQPKSIHPDTEDREQSED